MCFYHIPHSTQGKCYQIFSDAFSQVPSHISMLTKNLSVSRYTVGTLCPHRLSEIQREEVTCHAGGTCDFYLFARFKATMKPDHLRALTLFCDGCESWPASVTLAAMFLGQQLLVRSPLVEEI